MSNDHASIYKTQKTCPLCSEKAEFELPQDFHCPRCGRRKSLFLQAFDSHSSGVIHDKVVYLEDQVRVWKESYEELEHLARKQLAAVTKERDELVVALEKLARLGNEPHYGNSTGNQIAIDALAKLGVDKMGEGS